MARRTAEDAAATRAELVAVARRLFARDGFPTTTLADIAAAAGVTRGAVHHHFGDKRALFLEVFHALEAELDDAIVTAAEAAGPDPWEQLRAGCRAMFAVFGEPDYRQIVLGDAPAVLGVIDWYEFDRNLGLTTIRARVQALADAGHVDPTRVGVASVLLYGALNEAAVSLQSGSPHSPDDLIETAELLLAGLHP